jgi:hypothetical protein
MSQWWCWGAALQVGGALLEALGFVVLVAGLRERRRDANLPSAWKKRRDRIQAYLDRIRHKTQVIQVEGIASSESVGSITPMKTYHWGTTIEETVEELKRLAELRQKADNDIYQRIERESQDRIAAVEAVREALEQFKRGLEEREARETAKVVSREGWAIGLFVIGLIVAVSGNVLGCPAP